jgi:hypothetical protein
LVLIGDPFDAQFISKGFFLLFNQPCQGSKPWQGFSIAIVFRDKFFSSLQDCSTLAIFLAPMAVEILFVQQKDCNVQREWLQKRKKNLPRILYQISEF